MPGARLADAADFAEIAAITNHYIRTSAIHFGYQEVAADELRQLWRAEAARYPWLVVEHEGRIAGYAKASTWRARTAYQWTVETGVYIAHDLHHRGLGRLLYGRLIEVLGAQGYRSIVAGITLPNEPSVQLHEALGFTPVGIVRAAGFKFDRWHDVGFWQRELQRPGRPPGELLAPAAAFAATT